MPAPHGKGADIMASLTELHEEMEAKRRELADIFAQAGPNLDMDKVSTIGGDSAAKAAEIKRRNDEMTHIGQEIDRLELLKAIGEHNRMAFQREMGILTPGENGQEMSFGGNGATGAVKEFSPSRLNHYLMGHKGYRQFREGMSRSVTFDFPVLGFKTLITLSDINAQATRRAPVDMAVETRTVMDLMLQGAVSGNTVEYYEETTLTNAATTVAEGGTKPESALDWTLRTESVRKTATWIPATKESLDDVPFLESTIRGRLAYMVERVEETQVLTGDGVAPNLLGIMNRSGIQTQAKGADPTPDAIYKAMQLVRGSNGAGFAEPTAVVIHPDDWTDIKLLRTTDGIYIWGNPSDEGPDRIWGLPVRQTTAMTEGTGLVGAFRPYAEVLRREGINVTLSTEHSTYFVENKVAILAESRLALGVYRPSAFATVTGI
jgi:HK97 family phage major capsid protein